MLLYVSLILSRQGYYVNADVVVLVSTMNSQAVDLKQPETFKATTGAARYGKAKSGGSGQELDLMMLQCSRKKRSV